MTAPTRVNRRARHVSPHPYKTAQGKTTLLVRTPKKLPALFFSRVLRIWSQTELKTCAYDGYERFIYLVGLLLRRRVQHVLLRGQNNSAFGALQPQSQKGGAVAPIGEKRTPDRERAATPLSARMT